MAHHKRQMQAAKKAQQKEPKGRDKPHANSVAQRVYRDEMLAKYPLSPIDYMLRLMNDRRNPAQLRLEAAKAAAPYLHAKMPQQIEGNINHDHNHHHQHQISQTQQWIYEVLDITDQSDERLLPQGQDGERLDSDESE